MDKIVLQGWVVFFIMNAKMRFQSESHPGGGQMFHIQAKQNENPPSFLTVKIAPIGESYKIEAVTMVKVVWFEGPLKGQKREGHLHP